MTTELHHINREPIKCLDHGYVKLIDFMGTDQTIVAAARCSIAGEEVRAISDDKALIRYLMRHWHTTPFEAVVITVEKVLPIFVERQLVRHRTQSINEMSARYGKLPDVFYAPDEEHVQYQAEKNKQGRNKEVMPHATGEIDNFKHEQRVAYADYEGRINRGMAKELARINLPLSIYTKKWTTMNLHNAFHMLNLRKNPHAQYETRVYADAMGDIIKQLFPIAWEAFEDFRLNSMMLTASDIMTIRELMYQGWMPSTENQVIHPDGLAWLPKSFKTKREHEEFLDKFDRMFG